MSAYLEAIDRKKEQAEEQERKRHCIRIPAEKAACQPSMAYTGFYVKCFRAHGQDEVTVTADEAGYSIHSRISMNYGSVLNVHDRSLTPAESAWLE